MYARDGKKTSKDIVNSCLLLGLNAGRYFFVKYRSDSFTRGFDFWSSYFERDSCPFLLAILNCVLDASGDAAPYNGARS